MCIYTQQLIFFNFSVLVKEFYLSLSVKLFQKRFYSVVLFCFFWYKYSRRNAVRHIYTQLCSGVDFLCVRMYFSVPGLNVLYGLASF